MKEQRSKIRMIIEDILNSQYDSFQANLDAAEAALVEFQEYVAALEQAAEEAQTRLLQEQARSKGPYLAHTKPRRS